MTTTWPVVSLGEIIELQRRPVRIEPERFYAEIGTYSYGRGIFHKPPRTGLEVGDKSLFLVKEGDFILQITFAWEGAVAIASAADDKMCGSIRYLTFRVDERRCDPRFLLNYFKTPEGLFQLGKISPGSAGRNRVLSVRRLPEVLVPFPSITEQRRIVGRIDELAEEIQQVKVLRHQAVNELRDLLRSIVMTDPKAKLTPMRELVRLRSPDVTVDTEETYEFAGVYSFGRGVFRAGRKSGIEFSYPRLTRLHMGDFTYPKLMAWEGALGVVPPDCHGRVVSTEFPVFEVLADRVYSEVLDVYFRTPEVWPKLASASTGTNVRRRRLNPKAFLDHEMPLPSRERQDLLRKINRESDTLTALQAQTAAELDALLPSILDRAFRGDL